MRPNHPRQNRIFGIFGVGIWEYLPPILGA
jgi:hypothetical protein